MGKIAIQVGFRLHPRSMLITPYHELENENVGRLMFFERVPDEALKKIPMEWLWQIVIYIWICCAKQADAQMAMSLATY